MLIGGDLVEAASGKTFDNINPATEEVLGPVADASAEDMQPRDHAPPAPPSTRPTGRRTAAAPALPRTAAGRARLRARGAARGDHRRGGFAAHDDVRGPGRLAARPTA